ncbi:MAG: hypothetical protein QNJ54_20230 [Prochloraceae cyanobacterium]|nr:hypothetical protein [Prochloraceae cyanobacterium]
MLASVKTLLSETIDYAGLFPPAKLSMREALTNYACYQMAFTHTMLGHFVLPASRLKELEEQLLTFCPEDDRTRHWQLSLIASPELESARVQQMQIFNDRHKVSIAALEFPPLSPRKIEKILPALPAGIEAFFEIPYTEDLKPYIIVLGDTGAGVAAKIRTGGANAEAFPTIAQLYQFIFACAEAEIPFKATAGLHHPLTGRYHLKSDTDSPNVFMHGFLNVAVAAALLYWHKVTAREALVVLQESSLDAFQFKAESILWKDRQINLKEIKETRKSFFRSFGSCSFQEPIESLKELKLL